MLVNNKNHRLREWVLLKIDLFKGIIIKMRFIIVLSIMALAPFDL